MPSRVWLAAAFVIAFGASPARAATDRHAVEPLGVLPAGAVVALQDRSSRLSCACKPDDLATAELADDPKSVAESRGRVAVAE